MLLVVGGSQQDRRDGQDKQDKEVESAKAAKEREFDSSLESLKSSIRLVSGKRSKHPQVDFSSQLLGARQVEN